MPGVTGALGKANSHFDPTQRGRGLHHQVEAAVDWCRSRSIVSVVCSFTLGPHSGVKTTKLETEGVTNSEENIIWSRLQRSIELEHL